MTGAPKALVPAFVLHRRRYGDRSLLLELFTLDRGRLPAVARGAAAAGSRRRGVLQPFIPLLVGWRGRGEVLTLTRAEAAGRAPPLQGRSLYCGFYLNELLQRLWPREEPAAVLFEAYGATLAALAAGEPQAPLLRRFELTLLRELGQAPELTRDAAGHPLASEGRYRLEEGRGLVRLRDTEAGGYPGALLLALAEGRSPPSGAGAREARRFLQQLIEPLLGGRPLKSRALFRTMAPSSAAARQS